MKALRFSVNIPQYLALMVIGKFFPRAFYSGALATLKFEEVPEPVLPGPDWAIIKTRLCGFCASDLNLIFLKDSPTASPFTSFPCIIGHEICGEIAQTGENVSGFSPGDRVAVGPHLACAQRGIDPPCAPCRAGRISNCENFANGRFSPGMFAGICADLGGGFAPYLAAHKDLLFPVPSGVDDEVAVLTEPFAVALQAVYDNMPSDNDHVLVIGAGVIGTLIIKAIRAMGIGCHITVSEPSSFHGGLAKEAGADALISDGDLFSAGVTYAGATRYKPMLGKDILMGGFDRIFDVVGSTQTLNTAMRCMASGGRLSVVGIGHDVKLDLTPLWLKFQSIIGVFASNYVEIGGKYRHMFDYALELAETGKADLSGIVTHRFALEEYETMIETNMNKSKNRAVKTVADFR